MGLVSAVARRGARRAPRVFHVSDPKGYFESRRGPMAMGAFGIDPRLAEDGVNPLLVGAGAAGLGVAIPAFAIRGAFIDQALHEPDYLQARSREQELERRLRRQAVQQGGYVDGLEMEHQRLMREMERFGTYEDQWERQGR